MKKNIFENYSPLGSIHRTAEYEVAPELVEHKDILEHADEPKQFFRYFYLVCFISAIIFVFRLVNIQITHGWENRVLADGHKVRLRQLEPPRGIISNSSGQPLVSNIPSYSLDIYPMDLPKSHSNRQKIYQKISNTTHIPIEEFNQIDRQKLYTLEPITIKENIERDLAIAWECQLNDLEGVVVGKESKRVYSSLPALSHILGYVGKISEDELKAVSHGYNTNSRIGKTGLENSYEKDLRGKPGTEELEVDSKGRIQRTLSRTDPTTGNNLILSLDSRLQTTAVTALQQAFIENKSEKGVAIAMNPKDGSILAFVSLPAYDNNLFARGISQEEYNSLLQDKAHPMLNRATSGTYPSGSVIKPIIATAALQEKTISPTTKLDTSAGVIKIGSWIFPDWKTHGITNVRQAISESNDLFFYSLGGGWQNIKGLGISRLNYWLQKFSFGTPTGIDLPNESAGLVPSDAWKQKMKKEPWYIGDTYHLAIGQGYFLSTPLQMAVATSAIANDGDILKPHLVSQIIDSRGNIIKTNGKQIIRAGIADKSNLQIVREGMRQAVVSGSAFQLRNLSFTSAAKTGTAQFGDNTFSHAWFTAFAPYENPEIVVVVLVESGGQGSITSAPVAKAILQSYFDNKK
ncbi:MAG: penicillin-binding protein 2 [bacterium]|nr:penicillin-binding protein 2 [bacterium]